jgi:hypothetical protein
MPPWLRPAKGGRAILECPHPRNNPQYDIIKNRPLYDPFKGNTPWRETIAGTKILACQFYSSFSWCYCSAGVAVTITTGAVNMGDLAGAGAGIRQAASRAVVTVTGWLTAKAAEDCAHSGTLSRSPDMVSASQSDGIFERFSSTSSPPRF